MLIALKGTATTIYISPTGSDLTGNGSLALPYKTLGKACTVSVSGDLIFALAGTYIEPAIQVLWKAGVNIDGVGSGAGGAKITLTYTVAGSNTFNSAAIQAASAVLNTNGNQSIKNIWFDGNNFTCLSGILVRARGNVVVQNCKFTNFGVTALNFNGKLSNVTGMPPSTFSANNQVLNCSFYECSDRVTNSANSVACGSISYSGQRSLLIQSDTLSNTAKGLGHNGNLFSAVQGNNIGVKWFYNILTKPLEQNDGYNFGIESWYDQGGCEFAYNTYIGGGNMIDCGYGGANKGDSTYSWYVHHNLVNNPTLTNYTGTSGTTGSLFFQLEATTFVDNAGSFRVGGSYTIVTSGTTNFVSLGAANNNPGTVFTTNGVGSGTGTAAFAQNASIGDAVIEYNYLINTGTLVQIAMNNFASDFIDNIYVNHNVCENMGYSNASAFGAPFLFTISRGIRIDSVFIYNNTIVGTPTGGFPKGIIMMQPNVGVVSNIYFRNNICMNALGYGYMVFRGNKSCNTIFSQNNITFQNASVNNPVTLNTSFDAGFLITGNSYRITSVGTTNWVAIGAASNTTGLIFTALGPGSGTGIASTNIPQINFTNQNNVKSSPIFVSPTAPIDYHLTSPPPPPGSPGIGGGLNPPATYIGAYPAGTITPTITWANPAAITYGTLLSGTQLNATSGGVPGTFVYTPAVGTLLNAGTQTLNVVFTPTDQATYSVVSKSVTLVVNKATATLTYSNLTQTFTGLPLQPTVTTSPAGLTIVSTTYNGVGSIPTNAGTYTVISGLNNPNYTATAITNTFTISKATATLTISNLSQVYNGTPKPITTTTSPAGLSGVSVTYNGSAVVPTNAGSYPIIATLTNPNYTATNAVGTLVIDKATPTVTWANPSAITYPTALSGTQLNATASVAGVFTYTPASGTVLNAGSNVLSVNFTPTDAANYNSVNNTTVTIVVNKATATINVSNLTQFFDGNPKPVTVTTTPAALGVIAITYNGSPTAPSAVGSYPVHVTLTNANYTATPFDGTLVISNSAAAIFITNLLQVYTGSPLPVTVTTNPSGLAYTITYAGSPTVPTNVGSYQVIATLNSPFVGADTQTLVISKATPVITWPNPADIAFGTALSGTQLNASASVAGVFVYNPVSGTVLNVGTQNLSVTFTPTDAANYNVVSKIVPITVTGNVATLTLSNLAQVYNGTPRSVIVTTSPVGLSGVTITYNGSSIAPTNAGTYTINVTLVNANYTATPVVGTLVISKATSILSWGAILPIQFGTALSSIQLNATSNIAGTFSYNPPSGTVLPEGTNTLTATFTPTDATNYNVQTIFVTISVYGDPFLLYYIIHGGTYYDNYPNQNFAFPP